MIEFMECLYEIINDELYIICCCYRLIVLKFDG